MSAEYFAYLEILRPDGDADRLYEETLQWIGRSKIAGRAVLWTEYDADEQPAIVPHFGYNNACGDIRAPVCTHIRRPYGVARYFGITLTLEGEFNSVLYGRYAVPGREQAQLIVCGGALPGEWPGAKRPELARIDPRATI